MVTPNTSRNHANFSQHNIQHVNTIFLPNNMQQILQWHPWATPLGRMAPNSPPPPKLAQWVESFLHSCRCLLWGPQHQHQVQRPQQEWLETAQNDVWGRGPIGPADPNQQWYHDPWRPEDTGMSPQCHTDYHQGWGIFLVPETRYSPMSNNSQKKVIHALSTWIITLIKKYIFTQPRNKGDPKDHASIIHC